MEQFSNQDVRSVIDEHYSRRPDLVNVVFIAAGLCQG